MIGIDGTKMKRDETKLGPLEMQLLAYVQFSENIFRVFPIDNSDFFIYYLIRLFSI